MIQLALALASDTDIPGGNIALWAFLSIGAVALFGIFLPVSAWMDTRRREREAYYKAETIRRVAEATGEGAAAAVQLMREDDRLRRIKKLEGMKVGGLVNIGVGIGVGCLLWSIGGREGSPYLVGLIPGLIGVALLVYSLFMAAPIEPPNS
ncbi:MAG TPA: hypothetical protein VK716_18580 [Terracidiphilus sp.]|jgi:hypothetical protein|nr:hypothetical protein [Terracidiphilus sp.]